MHYTLFMIILGNFFLFLWNLCLSTGIFILLWFFCACG